MLTVIIPCHNEENYVSYCLGSLLLQERLPADHGIQVLVAANGCTDHTVAVARAHIENFQSAGFSLEVIDIDRPGKTNALNVAERHARYEDRVYIDADIVAGEGLLVELLSALSGENPIYASGTLLIAPTASWATRCYSKVWARLPFVVNGVPGIGVYAVNRAGRKRWDLFPPIIADDRFVRINFLPEERRRVGATYQWPLPEGFGRMLNVRRRWTEGNIELARLYPQLTKNDVERNDRWSSLLTIVQMPVAGIVFMTIYAAGQVLARVQAKRPDLWRRGRA